MSKPKNWWEGVLIKDKQTRREKAGVQMADALTEWLNMMYNKSTAQGILKHLIERLQTINFKGEK